VRIPPDFMLGVILERTVTRHPAPRTQGWERVGEISLSAPNPT